MGLSGVADKLRGSVFNKKSLSQRRWEAIDVKTHCAESTTFTLFNLLFL